jgi:hypothetical protein
MPPVLEGRTEISVRQGLVFGKVFWLKATVSAGLLAGFLLSPKLWISSRYYPLTPVWPFWKPFAFPFDYVVFVALLVLVGLIAVVAKPVKLVVGFVSLALVYALFDQSRWQPWFYQYLFMLAALGLSFTSPMDTERRNSALPTCRLIVASIYFWSAIQKVNATFVQKTFPWMIEPLVAFLPVAVRTWLHPLGFAVPFLEMGIAIGLLTRRFRTAAVLVALSMHLAILASIGPWGRNYNDVVWPWNIAMGVFVVLLFWRETEVRIENVIWGNKGVFHILVLLLFAVAPVLSLFNIWDSYLSFALYSGNKNVATIHMTDAAAGRLPDDVREYLTESGPKSNELGVSDWSWGELNVPPYPEIRIFKRIGRAICSVAANSSDVKLVVQEKTKLFQPGRQHVYDCAILSK